MTAVPRSERSTILRLMLPIALSQLCSAGMNFVDAAMVGHRSTLDLAAVSIGGSIYMPLLLFLSGIGVAIVARVASANGAGNRQHIRGIVHQGFWLILLIAALMSILLFNAGPLLKFMQVSDALSEKAQGYTRMLGLAIFAAGVHITLGACCQGLSKVRAIMVASIIGLLANIPLNWIFIYGKFGLPALGATGCGIATALSVGLMALILAFYLHRRSGYRRLRIISWPEKPATRPIGGLAIEGLPIATAIFAETTIFAAVAILIAPLGAVEVAAHQVALNFSTMVFMLPLSLGMVMTIRTSHLLGQGLGHACLSSGNTGLKVNLCLSLTSLILMFLLNQQIPLMYSGDTDVTGLAARLLLLAGLFQIPDGQQVALAGILRGHRDGTAVMVITLIAYWGIGLPAGCILGLRGIAAIPPLGATGFWIGLVIGLSMSALGLGWRLRQVRRRGLPPESGS
jgi:MATE family multidrug resistance protein